METSGIFSGATVLELASVLAGPAAGQFFAELGARVIKIENHRTGGDVTRSWKAREEGEGMSAYFSSVNWGKESLGLDLTTPQGREILQSLARSADIIITSFKPGAAAKLGADYPTLKMENPSVIYGSVTGYGPKDPRVGYDAVIQAESGFMSINGEADGPELKLPVALIDVLASHQLRQAVLLAWIRRLTTGEGAEVSVSLFDAAVASLANQAGNYFRTGISPGRTGSLHPNIAPYGEVFRTADDQKILLAIGTDRQFDALCGILSLPDLPHDEAFRTNARRVRNRTVLGKLLEPAIGSQTSLTFLDSCRRLEIPCGRLQTIGEALEQEGLPLLMAGDSRAVPVFVGGSKAPVLAPPPALGQHGAQILKEMTGLSSDEITRLHAAGVVH